MRRRLVAAVLAFSTVACKSPKYPVNEAITDTAELALSVNVPLKANSGTSRAIAISFEGLSSIAPSIRWSLEVRSVSPNRVIRQWSGLTRLQNGRSTAQVIWDGKGTDGRSIADGVYAINAAGESSAGDHVEASSIAIVGSPAKPATLPWSKPKSGPEASAEAVDQLPFTVFFGNLHSQTNHSDGGAPPATCSHAEVPQGGQFGPSDAYDYAQHTAALDFLVTSEHNHMYDGSATTTNANADPTQIRQKFREGLKEAADYRAANPPFVAVYGTEFGVIKNHGHINLFNPDGLATWEQGRAGLYGDFLVAKEDYAGLYDLMSARGWVGQFNHPQSGQFEVSGNAFGFTQAGSQVMVACEVSNSSAFSNSTDETASTMTSFQTQCDKLLLNGYRLALTSNQDNHCANWGRTFTNRTGILIPNDKSFSLAEFLDALKHRRTFATTDKRSQILLRLGDKYMGDVVITGNPVTLSVHYKTGSGAAPALVEIHHGVVGTNAVDVQTVTGGQLITTPADGVNFYYAEVKEDDGGVLWSSPIWVQRQ